jgi:hypothetical protein
MIEQARSLLPLACRDLVAVISARESFESLLEAFARRRAALYARPQGAAVDELYWPVLATALAPIGPPQWMPMCGLIESGTTLEGGARGLRGLFIKAPSEKERRRVLKIATLAARIMEIVANSDGQLTPDESRLVAMAMASFGLTADELAQTRPPRPLTYDNLEIFGDLDVRTRRELLRGAWQLAVADKLDPQKELQLRGIAARLELTSESDALRAEVLNLQSRQSETATLAVEIARGPARALPFEVARPWLEHLVLAAAPVARRIELINVALNPSPLRLESLPRLDTARRRQAVALALATLLGSDPSTSVALHLRAELTAAAVAAGAGGEVGEAYALVDRYLLDRVRDVALAPPESPAPPANEDKPAAPPEGSGSESA